MEHIARILEAVLWVGLFGGIVWRFHRRIDGLLTALQKRIESGSSIKAGPFELSDLRPLDPLSQRQKATGEIQEVLQADPEIIPPHPGNAAQAPPRRNADLQARVFQAEDLALRAIQAEYGTTVSRHVTAGADMGFDGAFVAGGRLNIVEVKYARSSKSVSRLRATLERLVDAVTRYNWKNVHILLAVVFETSGDLAEGCHALRGLASSIDLPVTVRCYSYPELLAQFGATVEEDIALGTG